MHIRLGAEWSHYASAIAGLEMLGVVHADNGDVGALARTGAGAFVQVNGALIRDLDRTQVERAIAKARADNVVPFARKREAPQAE